MAGIPNNPLKRPHDVDGIDPRPSKKTNTGPDGAAPMPGLVFGALDAAIAHPMVFAHPGADPAA